MAQYGLNGDIGLGILIQWVPDAGGNFDLYLVSAEGFNREIAIVDVSSAANLLPVASGGQDRFRTFQPGLIDPGEFSTEVSFDTTQEIPLFDPTTLLPAFGELKVIFPLLYGGTTKGFFRTRAFVQNAPITTGYEEHTTIEYTWKLSGNLTFQGET